MNCKDAIELLERMMFEEVQVDAGLRDHLETCPSCNQLYKDTLKSREALELIRCSEPVLSNPEEFTHTILSALPPDSRRTRVVPFYLQRMLAAASVAIFLLFGYEQYSVVSKISSLEKQFSGISEEARNPVPWRLTSATDINKAGISFSEMEKLLSRLKGTTMLFYSYNQKRLNPKK